MHFDGGGYFMGWINQLFIYILKIYLIDKRFKYFKFVK